MNVWRKLIRHGLFGLAMSVLALAMTQAVAKLQERQTVSYWKDFAVTAEQDTRAAIAHRVFTQLLAAWQGKLTPPQLLVVRDADKAWAASMPDGYVLISLNAIDICLIESLTTPAKGLLTQVRLAFVLAHELAHQQANDIWHLRQFRPPRKIENFAQLSQQTFNREVRADQRGILTMSAVGFDPLTLVSEKKFLIEWIEAATQQVCRTPVTRAFVSLVCQAARKRTDAIQFQMEKIAEKSRLFQLGNHAFLSQNYQQAQAFFDSLGRDFQHATISANSGLACLAGALQHMRIMAPYRNRPAVQFEFPLYLASVHTATDWLTQIKQRQSTGRWRSAKAHSTSDLNQTIVQSLKCAQEKFTDAMSLAEKNRWYVAYLIVTYVLQNKPLTASAKLQERYLPVFGEDLLYQLLSALLVAANDRANFRLALQRLQENFLDNKAVEWFAQLDAQHRYITYLGFENMQILTRLSNDTPSLGPPESVNRYATIFSQYAKTTKHAFEQYRADVMISASTKTGQHERPSIHGVYIDGEPLDDKRLNDHRQYSLSVNGDKMTLYRFNDGANILVDRKRRITQAWQVIQDQPLDRVTLKNKYGIPSRIVSMMNGDYLVYDSLGMALKIQQDSVVEQVIF